MSKDKVFAVVVTFNRRALLLQTLAALKAQTRPVDRIILIDNASTDGTTEALQAHGFLDDPLIDCVRMETNTGGAGGFHEGMSRAMAAGADWIWVMDDDGCPNAECLANLVESRARETYGDGVVLGSLVIDVNDDRELSFPVPNLRSAYIRIIDCYAENTTCAADVVSYPDPCGYPWGMFFNASLFSRRVVSDIGLPRREMFIWGDESEYFQRVRRAGFKTYIVANSIFSHPAVRLSRPARFKKMYGVRNVAFIHKTYKKLPILHHAVAFMRILRSGDWYLIAALIDGMRGDLGARYHDRQDLRGPA
jgi:rhamnopyranosyl-N-acetylglucosaminyl-diphospho-decaprenol beta-1,3/1,4-galactofuranosyltransferase